MIFNFDLNFNRLPPHTHFPNVKFKNDQLRKGATGAAMRRPIPPIIATAKRQFTYKILHTHAVHCTVYNVLCTASINYSLTMYKMR